MKFVIEIDDESHLERYLSILSLGIVECLKEGKISCDDAMKILFYPGIIEKFEEFFPDLGDAIHLGTELEDVLSIIPNKYIFSIEQIKEINYKSIAKKVTKGRHVLYKFIKDDEII